jgi:membrane fusion protein (multidrug efflux system)
MPNEADGAASPNPGNAAENIAPAKAVRNDGGSLAGANETEAGQISAKQSSRSWWRRLVLATVIIVVVGVALYYSFSWFIHYLNRVSTDDAYVSGYVTYLGPRIASRVDQINVNEDDFVREGEVLVRLDAQPFQLAVDQAQADLQLSESQLSQAEADVRSQLLTAKASQYLAQAAVDQLRLQIASLRSAAAEWKLAQAQQVLAEADFQRSSKLVGSGAVSKQEYDQNLAALKTARDKVAAQMEAVQQIRAGLGLSRNTENLTQMPLDIEHRNPQVQSTLFKWATLLVQIGVAIDARSVDSETLSKLLDKWVGSGAETNSIDAVVKRAPAVQVARAKVSQARAALDTAELNLSYTEIKAPFDGFVTKRTVNPGDYATKGQNLLVVQSLRDVWVDANFKETALKDLRIGLPVDIYVDAYPRKIFSGRVAGFSPATGARLALLPPENATGNFVKVVQRLPVRIELTGPLPVSTPLFVGLSVQPEVHWKATPSGTHAGERLRLPTPGGWPAWPQPTSEAASRSKGELR